MAHFAVFSFGPSKNLPAGGGGLLLPITDAGKSMLSRIDQPHTQNLVQTITHLLRFLLQAVVVQPSIWKLLPGFIVEKKPSTHEPKWPQRVLRLPLWVIRFIYLSDERLKSHIARRQANSQILFAALSGISKIVIPHAETLRTGACLRFPILFNSAADCERVRATLLSVGLLKGLYRWDAYGFGDAGKDLARRLLTLPTYGESQVYVRLADEICALLAIESTKEGTFDFHS